MTLWFTLTMHKASFFGEWQHILKNTTRRSNQEWDPTPLYLHYCTVYFINLYDLLPNDLIFICFVAWRSNFIYFDAWQQCVWFGRNRRWQIYQIGGVEMKAPCGRAETSENERALRSWPQKWKCPAGLRPQEIFSSSLCRCIVVCMLNIFVLALIYY